MESKKKNVDTIQSKYIEIKSKLDWSLQTYEERLSLIKEILNIQDINGVEFADDFWLNLFEQKVDEQTGIDSSSVKACLNQNDSLYTDSYPATTLETISTYLLNSPSLKKDKKDEPKLKLYHTKEMFQRAIQEEKKRQSLLPYKEGEDKVDFSIFVRQRNFKKSKDIELTDKIIRESKSLTEYNNFLEKLKARKVRYAICKSNAEHLVGDELKKLKVINRWLFDIKKDMLDTYISENRPIKFKAPLKDSGSPNWDALDMMDIKVIKALLTMDYIDDINSELNIVLMDLESLIGRTPLTNKQEEILDMYRKGVSIKDIAAITKTTSPNISQIVNSITRKISKQYFKDYEDWYYLNISKGIYEICSDCGCIKLKSQMRQKRKGGSKFYCEDCYESLINKGNPANKDRI